MTLVLESMLRGGQREALRPLLEQHIASLDLPRLRAVRQLDRFLLRITLGYPDRAAERELLAGGDRRAAAMKLEPLMRPAQLEAAQQAVLRVRAADALLDYLQALIAATRSGAWFVEGLSPRAGIALLRVARARALMAGRDYVAPDDVQAILPQAVAHRLQPVPGAGRGPIEQVRAMVEAVPIP